MSKAFLLLPVAAAISSAGWPSARAQEHDDLPTIYVREVLQGDLARTPGAAARLTDEQLRTMRPYSIHDALDFVPGVRTIDDDAAARRTGIGIRGAPPRRSRKLLLLEDGTPINASAYLDSSAHYTPPMERLESIDLLKAAGQIVHGPLNNHGVVNFRNKRATPEPETTLELAAGTPGTVKRHILHRRTAGAFGLVGSFTSMDADGTFDIEETRFDDLYGALEWQIDEAHRLELSFTYFEERSHYDESNLTPEEFAAAPRTKRGRFGQEHNTFALNYRKADVVYDVDVGANLSISTKLFFTDVDRPRFTVVPGDSPIDALPEIVPDNPFEAGITGRMESRNRQYRTYGVETRMQLTAGGPHTLQWGLRAEDHAFDDMRNRVDGGGILTERNRGALIRLERYEAKAVSVFLQDVIELGDWVVTPGLRAEEFTQSKVREAIALDPGPHGPKESDRNAIVLPGVAVLYSGLPSTQVFGSVQRGYSPAIARTASGFPLLPEVGVNTQVGVRASLGARISYELSAFYNRLDNTLVRQSFTIDGLNVTLNSGDSLARGLDVGLRFDSAAEPAAGGNAFFELAYNYTSAKFDGGPLKGKRVPEIPLHAGSLTLGYEHAAGWHVSGTLSHLGDFYTDVTNTDTLRLVDEDDLTPLGPEDVFSIREPVVVGRVPGRTLLSARVSYRFSGGGTTIWLQGRNLTDKLYISDVENGLRAGAERTVVAGIRFQF